MNKTVDLNTIIFFISVISIIYIYVTCVFRQIIHFTFLVLKDFISLSIFYSKILTNKFKNKTFLE